MKNEKQMLEKISYHRNTAGFDKILGEYMAKEIIKLSKGPIILDLGCGDRAITKKLADNFEKVIGVDGSKTNIEHARKSVKGATFYHSLIEDFYTDEEFNTIILGSVLEHVDNPITVLQKTKGWLNEEGYIVIVVPNAFSLHRRIGKMIGILDDLHDFSQLDIKLGHKRVYDMEMLQKNVEASGLKTESSGGIFLKPLPNNEMELWSKERCDAYYEIGKELPEWSAYIYVRCGIDENKSYGRKRI